MDAIIPTPVLRLRVFELPLLLSRYLSFQGWEPAQPLFGVACAGVGR